MTEGVVKFSAEHREQPLPPGRFGDLAARLVSWRALLVQLGGIGQLPSRYGGAGFGNVSGRIGPFPGVRGARAFLVTGTQTGGNLSMGVDDFCAVIRYDIGRNSVVSYGPVRPSSESMTHGAVYDLGPQVRFVLHVHCPIVWRQRARLRLPTTAEGVAYGTPQMAREVERLHRDTPLAEQRIFAMAGHEDGLVVFGTSADEAGHALMAHLAAAYEYVCRQEGRLCW